MLCVILDGTSPKPFTGALIPLSNLTVQLNYLKMFNRVLSVNTWCFYPPSSLSLIYTSLDVVILCPTPRQHMSQCCYESNASRSLVNLWLVLMKLS